MSLIKNEIEMLLMHRNEMSQTIMEKKLNERNA